MHTKPLLCALLLGACTTPLGRFESEGPHMGTLFRIVVYAESEARAERGFEAAWRRIDELEAIFSDWSTTSEVAELARAARAGPTGALPVSREMAELLAASERVWLQSAGAFDPTVGPFVRLWRQAMNRGELPAPERLAAVREAVGFEKLEVEPDHCRLSFRAAGMRLDFGGIAKGFALDEALRALAALGLARALVVGGGDVAAGAPPPGRAGWRIALAPLGRAGPEPWIEIAHAGLSTSGAAERFVAIGGLRYSHIVDPRTGLGLTSEIGVSVLAADATCSDALATAISVLGLERGLALAEELPAVEARIVARAAQGRPDEVRTSGFPVPIMCAPDADSTGTLP